MQFSRYITYKKRGTSLRVWPWALKLVLIAVSFYYIVSKMMAEQISFAEIQGLFNSSLLAIILVIVFVLMGVNWFLESKKWQLVAYKFQKLSLMQAVKAILAGISLDAILPFGAGSVGSKMLSLNSNNRQKLIAPIIFAQGIQSFWTVAFGLIGLYQLAYITNVLAIYGGVYTVVLVLFLIALLGIAIYKFWPQSIVYIIGSLKSLSLATWVRITIISFFRYLVFLVQLLLLTVYLAPEIPITVLIGCITWMFFAKTIVPKPGHLGALGIRGSAVVFFLSLAGYSYSGVVLATLILWFINLAIPSLIGLFFVKDLNFETNS